MIPLLSSKHKGRAGRDRHLLWTSPSFLGGSDILTLLFNEIHICIYFWVFLLVQFFYSLVMPHIFIFVVLLFITLPLFSLFSYLYSNYYLLDELQNNFTN